MEKLRSTSVKGATSCSKIDGTDLSPVNDAKVSFDKESAELGPREIRLIKYLAEHEHTSPVSPLSAEIRGLCTSHGSPAVVEAHYRQ